MARLRGASASAIYPNQPVPETSPLNRITSVPNVPDLDYPNSPNGITSPLFRARSRTVIGVAGSTISEKDEEEDGDSHHKPSPHHSTLADIWAKNHMWTLEGISKARSEPPRKNSPEDASAEYAQTRECVAKAAASILGTSGEVVHELLSVSIHVLEFVPVPGLATAAKTLLTIWDAVQLVDTNRSACLRLTERCANTLLSIRSDVMEAGDSVRDELSIPIAKLVNSFDMIYAFLDKQIERPFIKRLLKRDEILKELEICDDELTDAISMFSLSVQIRILRYLQDFQRTITSTCLVQNEGNNYGLATNRRFSASSQQTLLNAPPTMGHSLTEGMMPPIMRMPTPSNIPEAQILPTLRTLHSNQNVLDKERDLDALRRLMRDALAADSDIEMMNALQIKREEMPDALGALQRMLDKSEETGEEVAHGGELGTVTAELGNHELDKKFFASGIDALQRMSCSTLAPLPNWQITKYEIETDKTIGMGFFSDVYRGSWEGHTVAIKVLCKSTPRELFIREAEIWKDLDHENVLKLFGASSAQGHPPYFFVSPYAKNGNLVDYLRRLNRGCHLGPNTRPELGPDIQASPHEYDPLRYVFEIAKGMQYLHENNILHGDLKACNVLVKDNGRCVISDFGQSEMRSEAYRISGNPQPHGTLRWRAPELLSKKPQLTLTPQMDVWSFSICCSEIFNMGRIPWPLADDPTVRLLITDENERPDVPDNEFCTPHIHTLLSSCWNKVDKYRPLFPEIVEELVFIRAQPRVAYPNYMSPLGIMMWGWEETAETGPGATLSRIPSGEETMDFEPSPPALNRNRSRFSRQESLSRSASFSTTTRRTPVVAHRRTASSSCMPEPQFYTGSPVARGFGTPSSGAGALSPAPVISSPSQGHYSPPPPGKEGKKVRRASVPSLVELPVQNTSQVSLGDVGYYRGHHDFVTLFNSFYPEEAAMKAVRGLPSLWNYIDGSSGQDERSKLTRVMESFLGLFGSEKAASPVSGSPGAKRRSLPARERPVGPLSEYLYFDKKAPQKWLKEHEPTILKVFGPSHHLKRKGDIKLVTGTCGQPSGLELACISTSFSFGPERGFSPVDGNGSTPASPILIQPGSPNGSSPIPIRPSTSSRRWSRNSGSIFGQF